MNKMYTIWIVIMVLLVSCLTLFGYSYKNNLKNYHTLESDLIEAADVYIKKNKIDFIDEVEIKALDLLNNGYINSLEVEEDLCSGYVLVKKKVDTTEYKAYIKCDNYHTDK